MQPQPIFDLDIQWDSDEPSGTAFTATGGRAALRVGNRIVWGDSQGLGPHWHWVDLLAFLAENWGWLEFEQNFPLPVSSLQMPPHLLRREAEYRWDLDRRVQLLDEERYFAEEERVCWFEGRHNLAHALPGLSVPDVFIMRQRDRVIVSSPDFLESYEPRWFFARLAEIGERIAERLRKIGDATSVSRLREWEARQPPWSLTWLERHTGAEKKFLQEVANDNDLRAFYNDDQDRFRDTPISAAARMGWYARMSAATVKQVLSAVRASPKVRSQALDKIVRARPPLDDRKSPADNGRDLAVWLRTRLFGVQNATPTAVETTDPEAVLRQWGIAPIHQSLDSDQVDAVCCWGEDLGPVILLNTASSRNRRCSGRRAALAHEMCHLLVDRHNALPFADLVGGMEDDVLEERARAFAAEFLLPRQFVAGIFPSDGDLSQWVEETAERYGVSSEIVAWQTYRSSVGTRLRSDQKEILRGFVSQPENLH